MIKGPMKMTVMAAVLLAVASGCVTEKSFSSTCGLSMEGDVLVNNKGYQRQVIIKAIRDVIAKRQNHPTAKCKAGYDKLIALGQKGLRRWGQYVLGPSETSIEAAATRLGYSVIILRAINRKIAQWKPGTVITIPISVTPLKPGESYKLTPKGMNRVR